MASNSVTGKASISFTCPLPSTTHFSPSSGTRRLAPTCSKVLHTRAAQYSRVIKVIQHSSRDDGLAQVFACGAPWKSKRILSCASATRVLVLQGGNDYKFREDGAELEVRIPLPSVKEAGRQLIARYITVDAQSSSLIVSVETVGRVEILLDAGNLYGSIRPSETVWFVDETEVVLSLKKADNGISWPDLVDSWQSLASGVSTLLKGTSVYVVGESSEANWIVAQYLAEGLEYVPLQTQQLIEHVAKASVNRIMMEEGDSAVARIEGAVLMNLSQHVRCVVATLGGCEGAAARHSGWNGLHSGLSVWVSQNQGQVGGKEGIQAYSNADIVLAMSGWDSVAARRTAEATLRALKHYLIAEKDLHVKKSIYVRLGCRGDWPELKPPGWDPRVP